MVRRRLPVVEQYSDEAFSSIPASQRHLRPLAPLSEHDRSAVHRGPERDGRQPLLRLARGSASGQPWRSNPDTLSDTRVGFDARLLGGPKSAFRLGAGAQLLIPSGDRFDYDTDDTYRAMARVLFAGDVGLFTYAGQVGVHVRPLDEAPTPEAPQGSELLFGVAGGARVSLNGSGSGSGGAGGARSPWRLVVGPEFFGETAFRSFFGSTSTALEGLLTGRIEGTADDGPQLRVKLGAGAGIDAHFGISPEWRALFAIEVFDRNADRDKDGISDTKDACPDVLGVSTHDTKTNGCAPAGR